MQRVQGSRNPYSGLARVRSAGALVVGLDPNNLPFSTAHPTPAGLDYEVAGLLAAELGVALRVYWGISAHDSYPSHLATKRRSDVILGINCPTIGLPGGSSTSGPITGRVTGQVVGLGYPLPPENKSRWPWKRVLCGARPEGTPRCSRTPAPTRSSKRSRWAASEGGLRDLNARPPAAARDALTQGARVSSPQHRGRNANLGGSLSHRRCGAQDGRRPQGGNRPILGPAGAVGPAGPGSAPLAHPRRFPDPARPRAEKGARSFSRTTPLTLLRRLGGAGRGVARLGLDPGRWLAPSQFRVGSQTPKPPATWRKARHCFAAFAAAVTGRRPRWQGPGPDRRALVHGGTDTDIKRTIKNGVPTPP